VLMRVPGIGKQHLRPLGDAGDSSSRCSALCAGA
jgi:hypothetical protein